MCKALFLAILSFFFVPFLAIAHHEEGATFHWDMVFPVMAISVVLGLFFIALRKRGSGR